MGASADKSSPASRVPLTDSAWFWLLVFTGMALLATELAGPKYGRRQAQIERQFQARQPARSDADSSTDDGPSAARYSTPENTIIRLWPIRLVLLALALAAFVALVFRRRSGDPS